MHTGVGALLSAEVARGELDYTRLEGRRGGAEERRTFHAGRAWRRGDRAGRGAASRSNCSSWGARQYLAGYDYKEFAGTDAVAVRGLAMYSPGDLRRADADPALVPAGRGASAGGRGAERVDARRWGAVRARRCANWESCNPAIPPHAPPTVPVPVSRVTDGVRTTVTLGLRLFGGGIGVGMARAVDRGASWRLVVDFTQGV